MWLKALHSQHDRGSTQQTGSGRSPIRHRLFRATNLPAEKWIMPAADVDVQMVLSGVANRLFHCRRLSLDGKSRVIRCSRVLAIKNSVPPRHHRIGFTATNGFSLRHKRIPSKCATVYG